MEGRVGNTAVCYVTVIGRLESRFAVEGCIDTYERIDFRIPRY